MSNSYYYSGDPYWTEARFYSRCSGCGKGIPKGNRIFYYPRTKDVFCGDCGDKESRSFEAAAQGGYSYNNR